jgi:hypothetical protein
MAISAVSTEGSAAETIPAKEMVTIAATIEGIYVGGAETRIGAGILHKIAV